MTLMKVLKGYNYNELVFEIASNPDVLNSRTAEEQIKLIRTLKECDYNELVCDIATDFELLKLDIEKHIKFMLTLKECNYNEWVFIKIISNYKVVEAKNSKIPFDKSLDDIKTLDEMKEYINQLEADKLEDIDSKTLVYKYKK